MIVQAVNKVTISEILRDLKKFLSMAIVKKLEVEKHSMLEVVLLSAW